MYSYDMMGILMLLSDVLSIITIALCFILKVPQILKLIKAGEASGISLGGLLLELSSYSVTMLYNYTNQYALLTYLEYPVIIIQEFMVIALVLHYQQHSLVEFITILTVSLSVMFAFGVGLINKIILTWLLPFTTPVGALSKVIQIHKIISSKNSDSVSSLTWFLSCFTNLTRIYTISLDSGDFKLLLNFTVSAALSGLVLLSAIYYQRQKVKSG